MDEQVLRQLIVAGSVVASAAILHGMGVLIVRPIVYAGRKARSAGLFGTVVRLIFVSLVLIGVHAATAVAWAYVFLWTGTAKTFEAAFYFALSTYTTLGFGDMLAPQEWRLLTGFAAMNGLLMFGLSAAVLVDAAERLRLPAPQS